MRKLFVMMAACLCVMSGSAQSSKIEGSWIMLTADGKNVQPYLKNYLPNGKIFGVSLSQDMRNQSPWIMGTYEVLSDSTFIEHDEFHSTISYQHDYKFDYRRENDSILFTRYNNRFGNAQDVPVVEAWKKVDYPVNDIEAHWDELKQQARAAFGRVAPEGKTVEQYGDELYERHEQFKKQNNLDYAIGILMVRADVDTTNLKWQRDVVEYMIKLKVLPAAADIYANRMIRLTEKQAPTPTDTSVVSVYRGRGVLFGNVHHVKPEYAEQAISDFKKSLDLTKASGRPYTKEDAISIVSIGTMYFTQEKLKEAMECYDQAISIFNSDKTTSAPQLGEAYVMKAIMLSEEDKNREAIDLLRQKAIPCFIDEQGKPMPKVEMELQPLALTIYGQMLDKAPKDKKLIKEYQQYMSDKVLCGLVLNPEGKAHEAGLEGEYYVMEAGKWNIESTTSFKQGGAHYVFQKDGKHVELDVEENQTMGAQMVVKTVDPSYKQQIIKLWKNYKKNK